MDNTGTNMYMPVAPAGGMGDGFGASGWWIILLFLFMGFGGGFGGYGNNNAAGFVGADVQRGFDQASVVGGIGNLQNDITAGFAGLQNTLNANQMANMNQGFQAQTSILQGFNGLQQQLSQCCCDNRLATVQTQQVVQTEAAATRLAIEQQTQAILDKMCQQEIDNLKAANIALQNQVNMLNLAASQEAQTRTIIAALPTA